MRLRYAGTCRSCGAPLPAGSPALYDRDTRSFRCIRCPGPATGQPRSEDAEAVTEPATAPSSETDIGPSRSTAVGAPLAARVAGASARREFERRRAARKERIRTKHPRLGGLILAVSNEPQSTKAWAVGADGEKTVGRRLDSLAGPSVRSLHDRRIPRTRANIDHIVTCASGVYVIDAKQYKGRPQLRVDGGFLRERTEKLMVGSRDCTKLVDSVLKQVELVRAAVGDESVPINGFLCFVSAEWPLFGGAFAIRGVGVLWTKKLAAQIGQPGRLDDRRVGEIHQRLARAFPLA